MTKYTPGPWVTDKATIRTQAEPGWLIATIENAIAHDANARLIAEAPALADALRQMMKLRAPDLLTNRERAEIINNAIDVLERIDNDANPITASR